MKTIMLPKDRICPHCELIYRQPETTADGREVCPHCKHEIKPKVQR